MDAESRRRRRESSISLREQRWSMSSQRLEQIVAALMKPVSHYGQSFDRDDSGLLEEYLTAAGLRALEAVEAGGEPPPHNYAEMGLVIQSFANNYSKKVDHLSRLVNSFRETLGVDNVTRTPDAEPEAGEAQSAEGARRRRTSDGAALGFARVQLSRAPHARRDAAPPGPPPTLPRVYPELQPRAAADSRALLDYDNEVIGALDDFRTAWRLHDGFLVEELAQGAGGAGGAALQPLSLMELQEACARGAAPAPRSPPPSPPARSPSPSPSPSPCPPEPCAPPHPSPLSTPPVAPGLRRKRRSDAHVEDVFVDSINIDVDDAVRCAAREFALSERWLRRVVRFRRDLILSARRLAEPEPDAQEFRGYDSPWMDIGGFQGWTRAEIADAHARTRRMRELRARLRSEGSEGSEGGSPHDSDQDATEAGAEAEAEAETWRRVALRAAERAPLVLPALARDVLGALPAAPHCISWQALARATHAAQPQRSRVLLDLLMKATAGEIEIEQGAPLSVDDFQVRLKPDAPREPPGPAREP